MKGIAPRVLLALACLMLPGAEAGAEELTAESILTMHRSGAPADIILARVDSPASTFTIATGELVTLRQAGVPESVISAIRARLPASPANVPLQPDDARLTDLVRLIGTGISESLIAEQVRQSDQTYVLSVNDMRYLEAHGAGERTIAALMATRAGRPAAAAVAPSQLVFDGLELVNDGFWRRNRKGRLVMRGDTLRWEGARGAGHNFEFQIPALGKVWYTCESRPSESFCYQLNLKIVKGDVHRFRDLQRESGSNAAVVRVAEALRTHFPRLPFGEPDD